MAGATASWGGRGLWIAAGLGVIVLAGLAIRYGGQMTTPPKSQSVNWAEVVQLNSHGVGQMDRFEKDDAVKTFEKVVALAPDWIPGRINLGIALLNTQKNEDLQRAREIFSKVLEVEPQNPYAHFCLGIIMHYEAKSEEQELAAQHFRAVTEVDPNDPTAWYWLGTKQEPGSEEANRCFRRALELDPHLAGAIYGLAMNLRATNPQEAARILQKYTDLNTHEWVNGVDLKYSEMGHYANAIGKVTIPGSELRFGPLPLFAPSTTFQVQLAPGTRWAKAADFGSGTPADIRRAVRERFGAVITVLDYNRDGKPDLFLVGAVVGPKGVRDLLLRNDGNGRFTDVSEEAGLAEPWATLGCTVADYDNDGFPDLLLTGAGQQKLWHNDGKGHFADVSKEAGIDKLQAVCLGATFVDLDQDGDLDLVIAAYETVDAALGSLRGQGKPAGQQLAVFINDGKPIPATERPFTATAGCSVLKGPSPVLTTHFTRLTQNAELLGPPAANVGLALGDFDGDFDLDLLVLADRTAPTLVVNDRLLHFHRAALADALISAGRWNGALVLDVNHDQRSDVVMVGPEKPPVLLVNQPSTQSEPGKAFRTGTIDAPPLLQAQAVDIDLDSWTDVVGLSAQHRPVLLHNEGGKLVQVRDALGADAGWPNDLIGLAVADLRGVGRADLLTWSEAAGLQLHENQGNGNHGLQLEITGHRYHNGNFKLHSNADGIGVWAMALANDIWTGAENTTLSAGLGQSRQPLLLGVGSYAEADVVRLLWPDNLWQAEFNQPTDRRVCLEETNLKTTSCPVLFTWNGQRFTFVTDFLGAGSMGECEPDGGHRPPRPEESVKIEADQLQPLDGHYVFKIAEPMDEVTYLDRLQLQVIDHPSTVRVFPDERFGGGGPPASQDLLAFREQIYPCKVVDDRGRDVTKKLQAWDRDMVRDFRQYAWMGYAAEHWIELDFGARLAKYGPTDRLILCLAGYTEYPYPEAIWAATQAGVALIPPVLERRTADGKWEPVLPELGFPAGLPRMMTVDLTGKLTGPRCVLRIRTNMEVYWDQIFVAPVLARLPQGNLKSAEDGLVRVTTLEVAEAELGGRGYLQELSPDGQQPTIYDYDRRNTVPFSQLAGYVTRLGDVTELLRQRDDRFAIFGPGDEITVRFDARTLPPLAAGWTRSFVLRTWGYCKDCGPFTATGDRIEPLPFQAMSTYPPLPGEHYPDDALHREYRRTYNTRPVGGATRSPGHRPNIHP